MKEDKYHIAVVSPGSLPIPAVKGGAVENLIELFLNRNEAEPLFRYTVFSVAVEEAEKRAQNYRYASFEFIPAKIRNFYDRIQLSLRYRLGIRLPYRGDSYIESIVRQIRQSEYSYDAVIVENVPEYVIPLRRRFPKIPIILHLHNDVIYKGCCYPEIVRYVTEIWSVSHYIEQRVQTLAPLSCRLRVLYNGIEWQRFGRNEKSNSAVVALRRSLHIPNNVTVLLFAGRLDENKGVKELLQAFATLSGRSNCRLIIVGSSFFSSDERTPYMEELNRIAKDFKSDVIFTGYVPYDRMPVYYWAADLVIVPSRCEEACALVCLEALMSGVPVIVSRRGGLVELVDETCARIIPDDEPFVPRLSAVLRDLIENPVQRKEMGKAAVKRSRLFSDRVYTDAFIGYLQDVLHKHVR